MRIVGGVVLLVVAIAGYVATLSVGGDVTDYRGLIILIVVPSTSVLFVSSAVGQVNKKIDKNTDKLNKVEKQTNGALTAKFEDTIENAVEAAIERAAAKLKAERLEEERRKNQ